MMTNRPYQSKVLIVGGSGFLSGTLARKVISRGNQVWTITRGQRSLPDGSINLIADRHDELAFAHVVNAAKTNWDIVVDCIAFEHKDIQQDIFGFEKLAAHLVFVSTDFVYAPQYRQFPQREDTSDYVTEGYGYQKRLSELERIHYTGELPWTTVRPCHIYGPGSELGCLPAHSRDTDLLHRMKAGEPLKLVGGGHFLQQPVLADDLADFLLDLQGNENTYGQVLNAAGPDVLESRTYYQIITDVLGVDLGIEEIPVAPYLEENPAASSFLCQRFYDMNKAQDFGVPTPGKPTERGLRKHIESLVSK